ncbi:MAG: uroporphyrinogen decarboxylase family protein [Bryobacteraceae bacterium]|jgi:uroporphyrinogen-III decarboxylase
MAQLLESIADMNPDAMATFTPRGMGGDTDLAEAQRRIGDRVCMIGGFDQFHFLKGCTPEETRREVRRCFKEAGAGGGYVLSPSDHFFEADLPAGRVRRRSAEMRLLSRRPGFCWPAH